MSGEDGGLLGGGGGGGEAPKLAADGATAAGVLAAAQAAAPNGPAGAAGKPLIEVRNLVKHFPITRGILFQHR
ncbi:MAG TPA: hypothetical protein VMD79_13465, partial [Solirubrobacteraceae bacterium]|nr:hypothetical protein [Solirubrobacteraceae bacterium]